MRWSRGPGGELVSIGNDADNTITGLDIRDVVRARRRQRPYPDERRPRRHPARRRGGHHLRRRRFRHGLGGDAAAARDPGRSGLGPRTLTLPHGFDWMADVETVRFFDGQVAFHADLPAGQVFRLYGAALGRKPDPIGFGEWVQELEAGGAELKALAAGFVGSAEFAARFGAPGDAGFVTLLYGNVLGRAPDAAGLNHWLNAMAAGGASRADALLGFSESAEHKQRTAAAYQTGLWVPDPEAVDVLRAYVGVLDRLPDAGRAWRAGPRRARPGSGSSAWSNASSDRRSSGRGSAGCPTATSWSSSTARRWTGRRTRTGSPPGRACSMPGSTAGPGWRWASPAAPR